MKVSNRSLSFPSLVVTMKNNFEWNYAFVFCIKNYRSLPPTSLSSEIAKLQFLEQKIQRKGAVFARRACKSTRSVRSR